MSVLVKGMEMPRSCFCCRFRANFDPDSIKCLVSGEVFEATFKGSIETRHSGECPLDEVPTPHGKLIDEDEVRRLIAEMIPVAKDIINSKAILEWVAECLPQCYAVIEAEEGE